MQTPLLDPFGTKIPDVIEHTLEEGIALTSKFNRKGSLLATGCSDGKVVLWDFDTKSPATSLDKHTMAVLGLSWSRNGRKLLTWAADQTVVVFDVKKGKACFRKSLSCVAKACAIHPRNEHMLLVCPAALDPLLITIKPDPGNEGMCIQESEHVIPIMASAPEGVQTHLGPTACFSRRGERMYFGTSWGTVDVYDTATRTRIQSVQLQLQRNEEPFAPGEELLYLPSDPIVDTISAQEKADIERQQKEEERIASMYERRLKEVTALRGKLQHHAGRRQQLLRKKKKSGKRVKKKGASDAQPKTKKTKATTPTAAPAAEASTATTQ
ncbi:hypothetical protein PTSG_09572 [Salpingoeca rosetta]|uniref:Uncharacterized protein n=1 Tax=Salpingoeca rosetta (strain ATCC 50818 / BSB-021) TaxID=946362 RepID=F2ULD8_SALR5|nr:uncharacterized protein PTSG_09572 [Salpingoeca rosetta]EGD77937.1 hypothetical protein PTSG_09572 [Salpingoeca rosetta]|eukprot:XP_004990000.1 hypothetical protein PTSG_09572 [Salpingoeca rosetta]